MAQSPRQRMRSTCFCRGASIVGFLSNCHACCSLHTQKLIWVLPQEKGFGVFISLSYSYYDLYILLKHLIFSAIHPFLLVPQFLHQSNTSVASFPKCPVFASQRNIDFMLLGHFRVGKFILSFIIYQNIVINPSPFV